MKVSKTQKMTERKKHVRTRATRPFEYELCSNCICKDWSLDSNNKGFCSGYVKNPRPKTDVLRFCTVHENHAEAIDLEVGEAYEIASILASTASSFLKDKLKKTKNLLEETK